MELSFNSGKFVASEGELNYKDVIDDFPTAKIVRILTYNISGNKKADALLDSLRNTNADVQLITNIPSYAETYFNNQAGENRRNAARKNINVYISKLNPEKISKRFTPYFNVHNHSKIIGTENIVYIGSANYSNESSDNIETGVIIDDKTFISDLYSEFFDKIKESSLSYYDETFSAFRLFIISLYSKFKHHHRKFLTDLYTDYERSKLVVADSIFIDNRDLYMLYNNLDELKSVGRAADDTYDESNEMYNDELEQLKECFDKLDIDWLQQIISEDGSLYRLVSFDCDEECNNTLETFTSEAYDEHLEEYAQKAFDMTAETYSALRDDFQEEADQFLEAVEKILSTLEMAIRFTDKWKASKVNPQIDNT